MRSLQTLGIVLNRINFGEADRIITLVTSDNGKLRLIAKGVRKERSKLAGGIELFSVSQISFIPGKKDIGTVVSTRLKQNFGNIVKDLERTAVGYNCLQLIDKNTEENCEPDYFNLLEAALASLDKLLPTQLVEAWFNMQLLKLTGHAPNLHSDSDNEKLVESAKYQFDLDEMTFRRSENGNFSAKHIKLLRLLFQVDSSKLIKVQGLEPILDRISPLVQAMIKKNQH